MFYLEFLKGDIYLLRIKFYYFCGVYLLRIKIYYFCGFFVFNVIWLDIKDLVIDYYCFIWGIGLLV